MENNIKSADLLSKAFEASSAYRHPSDDEHVSDVAAVLGEMDRDAYLGLLSAWRARYAALSAEIRTVKPKRKGGNTTAADTAREKRREARRLMAVRAAVRLAARRHADKRPRAA